MGKAPWMYEFERYAGKILVEHKVPGFSVGLAVNGEPVYQQGFGFRDVEAGLPCTATTVHGIGSVTKSFTCVCIMQLQERGKLNVHDPVVKYLPDFKTPDAEQNKEVTIHHLMTHTAGLPPLPTLFSALLPSLRADQSAAKMVEKLAAANLPPVDTYEELMALIGSHPYQLLGEVGTKFSYSNDGYALLGAIIEKVSGRTYEEYLSENLLKPAGMTSSTLSSEAVEKNPEATMLYVPKQDGSEGYDAAPGWWQAPAMLAAGFLRSTVPDMLRYMEIYRTGGMVGQNRILSPESVKAMTTPYIKCGPTMYYGYGLMLTPQYHGVSLVEHGGAIKGVAAYVTCVPEKGITGVSLVNLGGKPSANLLLGGVNALLGLPLGTRRAELITVECPAELLPDYLGTYTSGEGANIVFKDADGGGVAVEMEGKTFPARCVGEDAFAVQLPGDEAYATFLRDAAGAVHAVAFGFRIVAKAKTAS